MVADAVVNKKSLLGVLGVGLIFCAIAPGCSILVVDSSAKQCSSDGDCTGLGAEFANTFCSEQNVCTHSIDYCATNLDCINRTGVEQTICRKDTHKCVSLLSPECSTVFAEPHDIENDNVVIFGIHGIPSWGLATQGGTNAIEEVREDFQAAQGGLPPTASTNGVPRPVAWISCDVPIGQQALAQNVSDHLFGEVGVAGAFGPFATVDMTTYGVQAAVASGSLMMTVYEDQAAFDIPGKVGLFFTYGYSPGVVTGAHIKAVTQLEQLIRAKNPSTTNLKVAYVYVAGVDEDDAQSFYAGVTFNGKSAAANGPLLFQEYSYDAPSLTTYSSSLATVTESVKAFAPDIIVLRGADETDDVAAAVERAFPGHAYYVMGVEGRVGAQALVAGNESFRERLFGFCPGTFDQAASVLSEDIRYEANSNINGKETGPSPLQHAAYDLAYNMYYAAAAVGDAPVTGKSLGQALFNRFTRDGSGFAASAGVSSILPTFGALNAGQNISMAGVSNKGWWDPSSGDNLDTKVQYWCVAPPSLTPAPPAPTDPRVEQGVIEMNIQYGASQPNLGPADPTLPSALVNSSGQPETGLPAGCLSTQ